MAYQKNIILFGIKSPVDIKRVDSNHTCLAVINLDFATKKDETSHPQVFLKGCKYIVKKIIRHTIDDLKFFDNDSDEEGTKTIRLMIF